MSAVGRDANVCLVAFDHLQNTLQDADDGPVGTVLPFGESAQTVEVTKQFVSAVDEMNDHLEEVTVTCDN